jgi:hypothetical protein
MSIAIPVVRFPSLGVYLNINRKHFCFLGILPSNCSKMGLYLTGNRKAKEPLSRYYLNATLWGGVYNLNDDLLLGII